MARSRVFSRYSSNPAWVSLAAVLLCLLPCCGPSFHRSGGSFPNDAQEPVKIDYQKQSITGLDGTGHVLWTKIFEGNFQTHAEPDFLYDTKRVYKALDRSVIALDSHTGEVLWRSGGPCDRLYVTGDLLLATECTSGDLGAEGRLLVARSVQDGKEVFRASLPVEGFYPEPIREVTGLFLLQSTRHFNPPDKALLIENGGRIWHTFDSVVMDGTWFGTNRVFVLNGSIVTLDPTSNVLWTVKFDYEEPAPDGGVLRLPDNSMLGYIYCAISDDGVQLIRFNPADGNVMWRRRCSGLGVSHSKYHQAVTTSVEGSTIRLKSVGSFGTFIETLDISSGHQLTRVEH